LQNVWESKEDFLIGILTLIIGTPKEPQMIKVCSFKWFVWIQLSLFLKKTSNRDIGKLFYMPKIKLFPNLSNFLKIWNKNVYQNMIWKKKNLKKKFNTTLKNSQWWLQENGFICSMWHLLWIMKFHEGLLDSFVCILKALSNIIFYKTTFTMKDSFHNMLSS